MYLIPTSPRLSQPRLSLAAAAITMTLMLSSCIDQATPDVAPAPHAAQAKPARPVAMAIPQDSFQRDSQSIVGISYPAGLERHPGLAHVLVNYAHAQRAALANALALNPDPPLPYELTLRFTATADSPRLYAVRADGELYTGTASRPRKAAFIWLSSSNRLLKPDELIADPAGWVVVQRFIHESKATADATVGGTLPPLVPLLDSAGRISAINVLLNEGDVLVPASLLRPYAAPEYAGWFASDTAEAGAAVGTH